MRIAIIGTRGIPARYGGFETLAEELSARLAGRGHDVTVYCRSHYTPAGIESYRGVRLVRLPTIRSKYFDTIAHSLAASLDAVRYRYDAILYCNAVTALVCWLPRRLRQTRIILNVDGLERHRRKWNPVGRAVYSICERLSTRFADAVVTDAAVIERYYREELAAPSTMIPYGGDLPTPSTREELAKLGLESGRYVLYVSRFEPENNALAVVRAYRSVPGVTPLVMVGDAPYAKRYIRDVRAEADERVIFPGAIYGVGYRELLFHAAAYVQATEVGGTHPALVEAMGAGRVVFYNDTPENREVCAGAGIPFDARNPESLARELAAFLNDPGKYSVFPEAARARVAERYRWEEIADRYEKILAG